VPGIETRYDQLIDRLRAAAQPEREPPAVAQRYADTVRRNAYRVTDADIDALRASGLSEDEIFEITVSAAVAAGLERREAGLRALA
jgi:alkylhydroperoxidase family enzyme